MTSWTGLHRLLARVAATDTGLPVWWRDDDAVAPTPALDRLARVAEATAIPVHLAIIPAGATPALAQRLAEDDSCLIPVVHGLAHQNHAPADQKKAEFGDTRDPAALDNDLRTATAGMRLFNARLRPMFVPPWNRIGSQATALLPGHGFTMLSTYGPRRTAHPAPGLTQVNTHVDPIDWHGTRSLVDEAMLLDRLTNVLNNRLTGTADPTEPLGLLTHHLVHDEPIWTFTETLLDAFRQANATPWVAPPKGADR